jgi:hypothetical protein
VPEYVVTLGDRHATADDLHGALMVAAELAAGVGGLMTVAKARRRLVITAGEEVDEGTTELAREGLRPVCPSHGPKSHLGGPRQIS